MMQELYISITIYTHSHLPLKGWGKEKVIGQFPSFPTPTISLFPSSTSSPWKAPIPPQKR